MRWALREASARGLALHVVTAWEPPQESTFGDMHTAVDFPMVIAAEDILLDALIEAGRVRPDGDHRDHRGPPGRGVAGGSRERRAAGGRLPPGHGKIVGALLGSVSQHVAAHADCPVVPRPRASLPGRRETLGGCGAPSLGRSMKRDRCRRCTPSDPSSALRNLSVRKPLAPTHSATTADHRGLAHHC